MSRIAYVNGQYVRHTDAAVHIEDRGYQFSDGVYEVCFIANGRLLDEEGHLDRLGRSLKALRIKSPMSRRAMQLVLREVVRRNGVREGLVYLQVTRGVAPRNHHFPSAETPPAFVVTARRAASLWDDAKAEQGATVITTPEDRWKHPHIKTVSLLSNALAKQKAMEAGADEAWYVDDDDFVTEGSSTNAWIITQDGVLKTRPANGDILEGITRQAILQRAQELGLSYNETAFSLVEAKGAQEAFMTSASALATPIIAVDGHAIGDGKPGRISLELRRAYKKRALADASENLDEAP